MVQTSHSIDYANISRMLLEDFDRVIECFQLDLTAANNRYYGACPIHGGDNYGAFNMYYNDGHWKCYTKACHETFINTPVGFVRGILSEKNYNWKEHGDRVAPMKEVVAWCKDFLQCNISGIKVDEKEEEKSAFVSQIHNIQYTPTTTENKITKEMVRAKLKIPSPYFLDRNIPKEILNFFDVGDAVTPRTDMYQRAVVPIYDEFGHFMLGCSGRSWYKKCGLCKFHHKFGSTCPTKSESIQYVKWRHSKGFSKDSYLYNYWNIINKCYNDLIIVESPINVWKLYEAGYKNCVAILGSSFGDNQKFLLDRSGVSNLILLTDMDPAGLEARSNIRKKCRNLYKIKDVNIQANDIGDLSVSELREILK